jgi:glucokinase
LGVDIGGTKTLAMAVAADGTILGRARRDTAAGGAGIVAAVVDASRELIATLEGQPQGIGLGLAGFVDHAGHVVNAPNARALEGLNLRTTVGAALGLAQVVVDNDANCAAIAMARSEAPEAALVVGVMLGTGIGGGLVLGGRLFRGSHGFAGEVGHMVVEADGAPCPCGQRGCWEVWASGQGLGRLTRQAIELGTAPVLAEWCSTHAVEPDGPLVTELLQGEPSAELGRELRRICDTYADWVAVGLVGLVNVLDPDVVLLGGGITAAAAVIEPHLYRALGRFDTMAGRLDAIRLSHLGPEAAAVGAALLVSG